MRFGEREATEYGPVLTLRILSILTVRIKAQFAELR